ncbi:hypothetical protein B0T18DRAFT_437140 [Schizothecium vesticola]|uniref:FAD-binding domain-containing protein n=1 Tax=Schizothecium vesticola TaxID=314040 RepID=A0AA40F258_9PEZI|nr:hypothetical protein B0T18DRAFT_437140 [Schizothecium vesticola]
MGSNPPTPPLQIAILGAGIAGLALAAGLVKKPHLSVAVYEAVPAHCDVGAGLALHRNALGALALLGPELYSVYLAKATACAAEEDEEVVTEVILAHGPGAGQTVAELGRARGRKSVSRADLLEGLAGLVPGGVVRFGRRAVRVEDLGAEGVRVRFEGGGEERADCVIGADGIHSVVRGYLLGEEHPAREPKNHDGWQVYRTLVGVEEARAQIGERWTRAVPILIGPRGHVNCIPLNKGTRLSAGVAKLLDPELYSDYTDDAQRIVRMVAKDTSASWSVGDHDQAPFYYRGAVAMMGDAAHAALPFAGNGAAQALEDAAVLDHLFEKVKRVADIEAALAAYDAIRRPRSQAVVDLARAFGRVYAYADKDICESPEKIRAFFARAAIFTNEVDLKKQNDDAMGVYEKAVNGQSKNTLERLEKSE